MPTRRMPHHASQAEKSTSQHYLGRILNVPEDIPKDLLDRAECVIVFPLVKKFAIGVGGLARYSPLA
jgi:hypothetical protein